VAEALVVTKDLLRRFPDMAEVVVSQVMAAVTQGSGGALSLLVPSSAAAAAGGGGLTEGAARASLLWIIGQFGQFIPKARA
jgi:hypothetical protein